MKNGQNFCPICGSQKTVVNICEKCGKEISVTASYCSNCGNRIENKYGTNIFKNDPVNKKPLFYDKSKASDKAPMTFKSIILVAILIILIGGGIWSLRSLFSNATSSDYPEDGWTSLGRVHFNNDFAVDGEDTYDLARIYVRSIYGSPDNSSLGSQLEYDKKVETVAHELRLAYFTSRNLNSNDQVFLYTKKAGKRNIYEIRDEKNNKIYPVDKGIIENQVGEMYNAKIIVDNGKYQTPIYFNIPY